jgi:hypothetical protein
MSENNRNIGLEIKEVLSNIIPGVDSAESNALNNESIFKCATDKTGLTTIRIDFAAITSDTSVIDKCEAGVREYLQNNFEQFTENRINSLAKVGVKTLSHEFSVQRQLAGFQYVEEEYQPTNNRTDRPIILISVDTAKSNSLKIAS